MTGCKKETKKDKFVRMAESCTIKIISMVRLLGNCVNKLAYEYSDKDVTKIFNAIESVVANAKNSRVRRQGMHRSFCLVDGLSYGTLTA